MDQVKEYLQIAIKYRFWIVVGIAALMPLIGYFAAAGSIEEATTKATADIKSAYDGVKKYEMGDVINDQYEPLVQGKTKTLQSDVTAAWEKLYDRQAPLLTWPEAVSDRFQDWGPKWPENADPTLVKQAVIDYVETYRSYVRGVYDTLKPFDFETGEGIVVAPPSESLLMFPEFDINPDKLPKYGKVWDTQRRLWVQRTVLDVLAKVNERAGAKDWSSAAVKQILDLQVANELAQDQRSMGKGDALKDAPEIVAPGSETAAASTTAAPATGGMPGMGGGEMEAMMKSSMSMGPMMGGMGGMGMGMGMGMNAKAAEEFKLLPVPNEKQVYVVPVYLSVYVEQDRIPDLIVEFSNSPMNIQIIEFAMYKAEPGAVEKPEKGDTPPGMANMRGMGGMGMMSEMMMGGYGMPGMAPGMGGDYERNMAMMMAGGGGMPGLASGMMPGMPGMMPGMGKAAKKRQGVDVRAETLAKLKGESEEGEADADAKAKKKDDKPKNVDQYYNVVRVDLYGQARFFFPPPKPEEPAPSASVASELPAEDAAAGETPEAVTEAPADTEPGSETTTDEAMPKPEPGAETNPAEDAAEKPAEGEAMPKDEPAPAPPAEGAEPKAEAGTAPETAPAPDAPAEPAAEPGTAPEAAPGPAPDTGAEPKSR